jgi:hypothetical protein
VRLLSDVILGPLVVMTGIVAISGMVLAVSVKEGDSDFAWMWAAVFLVASLIDAWVFSRLV